MCFVALFIVCASLGAFAAPLADKLTSPLPGGYPAFRSNNYAGYLDLLDGRQAYYWFVESENSPSTDPLMFWFNGGPGCSSLLGLFTEIGPARFYGSGTWGRDDNNWATNMNIAFMESPGGVGFSVDPVPGGTLWNDSYVAQLNYAGVRNFLSKYPEYSGRRLYIAGESYAGHYVPQLVNEIVRGPDMTLKSMLKGFMAGNPCTGNYDGSNNDLCFVIDDPSLDEYTATHGLTSLDPNITNEAWDGSGSTPYNAYDYLVRSCGATPQVRRLKESARHEVPKRFLHGSYDPCNSQHLATWLNSPAVQQAIHVKPGITWLECANNFNYPTPTSMPGVLPLYRYFMESTNLDILVYSGTADTVVNFIQTQRILLSLGRRVTSPFTPWFYADTYLPATQQLGGFYQRWDRMSWASIRGAGHEVPMYQPARMKQLLNSFMLTGAPGLVPFGATGPPAPAPSDDVTGTHIGVAIVVGALGFAIGCIIVRITTRVAARQPVIDDAPLTT